MRKPEFRALERRLIDAGIGRRHARRAVSEMRDHYEDLVDAALQQGLQPDAAHDCALRQLGQIEDLVNEMAARPELRSWVSRYPRTAIVVYPLACLAALPAVPVTVGVAHASLLARWGASLVAAGVVTAGMLLILQLSILFG